MEEFQAHDSSGVEKLCVTADDRYLISAGKDGAVMIFEIRDKEARSDKLKEVLPVSN
jgi:CMP-N-acetylneuraminic acid synthetase